MKDSAIQSTPALSAASRSERSFGGQRAEADHGVGDADALAVGETGADLDRGHGARRRALDDAQAHLAVVEEQAVAGLERREDLRVGQLDALGVARRRVGIEDEGLAGRQRDRAVGEGADAELRALQVDEDADRPLGIGLDLADCRHQAAEHVVVGVAHVDAEDVGAGPEEAADLRLVGGRRTEGREDLDLARPPHPPPVPVLRPGSVSCTVQLFCSPVSTSKKPVRS